jgi:aryl-alcohol dehydrogenase-like predicted oxidoreductase
LPDIINIFTIIIGKNPSFFFNDFYHTVIAWEMRNCGNNMSGLMMKLKDFGPTDIKVSPMGLGMAALGRPGYINIGHGDDLEKDYRVSSMEAHAHRILDAAYEKGIRYFDAARSYGRAEEFLGTWLKSRDFGIGAVTVGSKWGYSYTADWKVNADVHEVKEHSLSALRKQWKESSTILGEFLNLYQIHSATLESGVLENAAVLTELARIRETGKIIGLSVSGPNQKEVIRRAIRVNVDGVRLFDSVQATWNLLEQSAGQALAEAKDNRMGVIVKEALANGRLTDRNTEPGFTVQLKKLRQAAGHLNTTLDALAMAAVIAQPWADVVLSGAAAKDHLESNLDALDVVWDDEAASMLAGLCEPAKQYWANRRLLKWQ